MGNESGALLEIRDLMVHFVLRDGMLRKGRAVVQAVSGVSLELARGEVFGLVGESGCGKTTLGKAVVGLAPVLSGEIRLAGDSIIGLTGAAAKARARRIQLIFQDPYASLHPRKTVRDLVGVRAEAPRPRPRLPDRRTGAGDPGGGGPRPRSPLPLRPRVLGRPATAHRAGPALILKPEVLILDEPTSALDVSVQAQTLNLLKALRSEFNLTYLFISHDLGVVHCMSQRIGVMLLGHIVETGATEPIFRAPQHPYTRILLSALPSLDPEAPSRRQVLTGEPPTPIDPPPGCPFAPRCPDAQAICGQERPVLARERSDAPVRLSLPTARGSGNASPTATDV